MRVAISGSSKVIKMLGVLTDPGTIILLQEAKKLFPNRLYTCEDEKDFRKYDVPLKRLDVSTDSLKALNPTLQ